MSWCVCISTSFGVNKSWPTWTTLSNVFLDGKLDILIQISLQFVRKGATKSALFHVMLWRRKGDRPFIWNYDQGLWRHKYGVTRSQWVDKRFLVRFRHNITFRSRLKRQPKLNGVVILVVDVCLRTEYAMLPWRPLQELQMGYHISLSLSFFPHGFKVPVGEILKYSPIG